jgi:hypothetical protein
MPRTLRRALLTILWLLIAAVIAIGGAGLVAATSNQPGTASRAELTAAGDAAAAPGLDRAEAELDTLTQDVERLGELGRTGLGALVDSQFDTLDQTVAQGQALAASIEDRSAQIRTELTQLPGTGPEEQLTWSPETSRRRDVALAALDATQGLEAAWIKLAAGSATASKLTGLLVDHDQVAARAAASGRAGKYADALTTLAGAESDLAQAGILRDNLANTIDVSTLTQWIDSNAAYDAALKRLYMATTAAKGRITAELTSAAAAERQAHADLPANTSGIVIILAEIARGGLNQAVIGIEQARARLQDAVDDLTAGPSPAPSASAPGGNGAP